MLCGPSTSPLCNLPTNTPSRCSVSIPLWGIFVADIDPKLLKLSDIPRAKLMTNADLLKPPVVPPHSRTADYPKGTDHTAKWTQLSSISVPRPP
jgi:hypothetical protein